MGQPVQSSRSLYEKASQVLCSIL